MSYTLFTCAWGPNQYKLFGNSIRYDLPGPSQAMAFILWVNAGSKIVEYLDTLIMILKGNFHQVTFLHVYHHATVIWIWWAILFFAPGGEPYFVAGLNSAVHVFMYCYYFFANINSSILKNNPKSTFKFTFHLMIKPYITQIQMIQFISFIIQGIVDLFILDEFEFPRWLLWIIFFYPITLLLLFGNFYIQSYLAKKKEKLKDKEKPIGNGTKSNGDSNGHASSNGHGKGEYPASNGRVTRNKRD
jgi:elongation of very long chain fatty acids protein 4